MSPTEARPCPACLSAASRPLPDVDGFRMRSCARCRTIFTAELPAPSAGQDYDSYYHEGNLQVPDFVSRRLEQIVRSFDADRRLNRWLDVGAGAGALLAAARGRGWEVVGTEVSAGAADAVRAKGFDVRAGELGDLGLDPGSFDVVSLVEVLEHVPDVRGLLSQAAELVRPGGVMFVTTPHARGVSGRVLGTGWTVVAPPEHLQLLSARGMRAALEASGLRVRRLRTHGVNPQELLRRLRRREAASGEPSRVDASYALNESLSSSRRGAVVKRSANAVLNATRMGDSIKLVAERPV